MKQTLFPSNPIIWTAEIISIPAALSDAAGKPVSLLFTLDQETHAVTGYRFISDVSSLSLIRLLHNSFRRFPAPDIIVASFLHEFEFDVFCRGSAHHCRVVRQLPQLPFLKTFDQPVNLEEMAFPDVEEFAYEYE